MMKEYDCRIPGGEKLLGAYELGILSEHEQTVVEEHLLHCNDCFENLYATSSLGNLALRSRARVKPGRKKWHIPAVAAAALILTFATSYNFIQDRSEVKRSSYLAGSTISLLGPRGTMEGHRIPFSWQSPDEAVTFNLVVFNHGGDSIWSSVTSERSMTVDIDEESCFEPHNTYYWKVMGSTEAGRLVATSPVYSFFIETN